MGAQMNIKSDEAYALATEIAGRTGETLTQVVLEALRARQRALTKDERFEQAMAICRDARSRMSPELLALDMDEYLYDERGLPK
ncbi:MAG: type II toxin-antitoxin system VapB family antitoxin [Sphingomonas sp.]|uniref:type II toxin-antitoxin system VapB family antitoxin n=1 Tax=Sphingomonas sp. TaxID=28214 RepID=UPI0025E800A6|nr:type II toxin-antitoxin system VapB family antitoxin [Sphingomonas sp.]MBY0283584.1 type II toxin-antitoxin system VapB family antitoxin [Sphingomonas sp.]